MGAGGQGELCTYLECDTNKIYAVKFDPANAKSSILGECIFMKKFCKSGGLKLRAAPNYILHDTLDSRRYLIMEHLSHTVDDYL